MFYISVLVFRRFRQMAPGEPDDLEYEDCIAINYTGHWFDVDCESNRCVICEFV